MIQNYVKINGELKPVTEEEAAEIDRRNKAIMDTCPISEWGRVTPLVVKCVMEE